MKKQVFLAKPVEPLYISYPKGYQGKKSGSVDDLSFSISTAPRMLTAGEIDLVQSVISQLPYKQTLESTGCVLVDTSSLPTSHAELDLFERENGMASTAYVGSTRRTARQRQIIIAERMAA